MNIMSLIFGIIMVGSMTQLTEPARLTGKITNCESEFIILIAEDNKRDTIRIGQNGSFEFNTQVDAPTYYMLYVPNTNLFLNIFMENGTSTHLEADVNNPTILKVSGDLESVYEFTEEEQKAFIQAGDPAKYTGFKAYEVGLCLLKDSLCKALNNVKSEGFKAYKTRSMNETFDEIKIRYMYYLIDIQKPLNMDADFNAFMNAIDLDDSTQIGDKISSYLYWKAACLSGNTDSNILAVLQVIKDEIANKVIADKETYSFCQKYFGGGSDDQMDAVYEAAKELLSEEPLAHIKSIYEKIKSFAPGNEAPNFEMNTPDGKTVRLSDLRGKAIYLDIWATWCGPCLKEIPFMAKLAEHYKGDSMIEIINISVDSNQKAWRELLKKDQPQWSQFIVPGDFNSLLLKLYGINGIPRFMMFDKDGRIIDINAPRPSSEDIIKYIDSHL